MYRSELERLMTLSSAEIDAACRGDRLRGLMTRCLDEHLELAELADEAAGACDIDAHAYYTQESAAWRATAHVLRTMATASTADRAQGAA
ncbi:hypothetical protein L5G32_07590 [Gordonia sp. HY002]|uniref:hypothetical protein n=1 Tax=Gordonia zhenghanii TaxID=2911516 RepID=UPI001EF0C7EB|nr:hypothetical protein [Gordonia zhenghanii]MCF8570125.1 hypothetical protein [Gordonia zhenghanii]MCF8605408.1 hypothetical protein [Gordonia zhenghanii]